jgi:hypothetical protein
MKPERSNLSDLVAEHNTHRRRAGHAASHVTITCTITCTTSHACDSSLVRPEAVQLLQQLVQLLGAQVLLALSAGERERERDESGRMRFVEAGADIYAAIRCGAPAESREQTHSPPQHPHPPTSRLGTILYASTWSSGMRLTNRAISTSSTPLAITRLLVGGGGRLESRGVSWGRWVLVAELASAESVRQLQTARRLSSTADCVRLRAGNPLHACDVIGVTATHSRITCAASSFFPTPESTWSR